MIHRMIGPFKELEAFLFDIGADSIVGSSVQHDLVDIHYMNSQETVID